MHTKCWRVCNREWVEQQQRRPKFSSHAFDMTESDPNISPTSRDAYLSTIRNHVEESMLAVGIDRIDGPLLRKYWTNLAPMKQYEAARRKGRSTGC